MSFLVLYKQYQSTSWYFLSEWDQQPFASNENIYKIQEAPQVTVILINSHTLNNSQQWTLFHQPYIAQYDYLKANRILIPLLIEI